ncbi:hypothetical protein [uncultured Polaribacter sp.]|uniref:hypothetical protein n=1 Tax=uncultured Polaribacter sp. TaxID=174711 RepID=UPI0026290E40|nr:hypothetical protein [uncultured Polaribacter sp.]
MKHWVVSKTEEKKKYLIVNEKTIWITEQFLDVNIEVLIEEKNIKNVNIFRYDIIKNFIFIDDDFSLLIEFKPKQDKDEIELFIDSEIYEEIKSFFSKNLQHSIIKNYSVIKQIKPSVIGLLFFGGLTALLYNVALSLQNGESIKASGRRGFIKKILVGIADFLGPTGSLIIGGFLTLLFIYILLKTIKNPKKGKVIKLDKFTEVSFN